MALSHVDFAGDDTDTDVITAGLVRIHNGHESVGCEAGRVDVLVVHDVPLGSKFWRTHLQQDRPAWRRETPWRTGMLVASDQHQRMLGELVSVVQPGVLFHGHHHMRVETQIGEAEVHGLGCNGMGQASWMIVDETGEVIIG